MTAHRADLHGMLQAALPERIIRLGANCVGATTTNGVAVARFADGSEVEGDAVIGADGIRSAIRAQLFGADAPRFTEQMCWRCMVPMELVPTRVGPGGAVELAHGEYFGWLGPNGHVICYPIGKGDMLNIFAGHVTDQWVEESWSVPSSQQELLDAYDGWNEALLGMFRNVHHVYKWGIYDRDPLPQWTKGRVTLLGDAAHPTMPTLAQGGNMAIEDGYVLARNLAGHGGDIATALQAYVAERQPRTSRVTLQSRQQFANNRKVPPPPFLDRSWIFRLRRDARVARSRVGLSVCNPAVHDHAACDETRRSTFVMALGSTPSYHFDRRQSYGFFIVGSLLRNRCGRRLLDRRTDPVQGAQ